MYIYIYTYIYIYIYIYTYICMSRPGAPVGAEADRCEKELNAACCFHSMPYLSPSLSLYIYIYI